MHYHLLYDLGRETIDSVYLDGPESVAVFFKMVQSFFPDATSQYKIEIEQSMYNRMDTPGSGQSYGGPEKRIRWLVCPNCHKSKLN